MVGTRRCHGPHDALDPFELAHVPAAIPGEELFDGHRWKRKFAFGGHDDMNSSSNVHSTLGQDRRLRVDSNDNVPFVRREIAIGGRIWLVETVDDQDALLAVAEVRAQFPFGLMLWESAIALAHELTERASSITGKSVLELGAGLGLSGVVAASLGAHVVQTDHDASALEACTRTAKLNGITGIGGQPGDWHDWRDDARYDLIIGADIAYDGADHAALLALFERNLAPGGLVLLADPGREMQSAFMGRAKAAGWAVTLSTRNVPDLKPARPGAEMTVAIIEIARVPA